MRTFTIKDMLAVEFNLLPTAIYDTFPSVLFGRVLILAVRLGIFEELHKQSRSAEELAGALHIDTHSTRLMLSSLAAMEYLVKSGSRYTLAPQATKWLLQSSPHSICNFLRYVEILHGHWAEIDIAIRTGRPAKTYRERFTADEWRVYTLGMMDLARLLMPHVIKRIRPPHNARKLLDVGASHGLYSLSLCEKYSSLHATLLDLPEVLEYTNVLLGNHPIRNHISFKPGDLTATSLGDEEYDMILAFNIIHGFDSGTNREFCKKAAAALDNGGRLFILDEIIDPHQVGTAIFLPLMTGLNLLNEIGGRTYQFGEIREWCEAAGLSNVRQSRLGVPGVCLVQAEKR